MTIKAAIKNLVTRELDSRGYELKEKAAPPRGFRSFLEVCKRRLGLPKTVFDIGVGGGTQWLYDAFPDSDLVLIEPLAGFEPKIRQIMAARKAIWHRCALGDASGELTLQVPQHAPTGASMFSRNPDLSTMTREQRERGLIEQTVPVRTLDEVSKGAVPPFVIKIDVEGAETNVLRGGAETIRSANLIIVEASIGPRYNGECDLIDIGNALKQAGFKLAEIIDMATFGPDKVLSYLDAAFVRADGGYWQERAG